MILDNEDNYRFRNLSLNILEKSLDDICPKFLDEPENIRKNLIKERKQLYKEIEKELDNEWAQLEKESANAVKLLKQEKTTAIKKLKSSARTKRIALKVKSLERNRNNKLTYLKTKEKNEIKILQEKLKTLPKDRKKYAQIQHKMDVYVLNTAHKVKTITNRYNAIIEKTLKTSNTEAIEERVARYNQVWNKKYQKIKNQFQERVSIFNNKCEELDLVRLALYAFIDSHYSDDDTIKHWCVEAGVSLKTCHTEVRDRLALLGRKSVEIDNILASL